MKNIKLQAFLFLVVAFLSTEIYAQAPNKMTYQAVVRDANNALIQSKSVGIRISILQGSAAGEAVYEETHTITTNSHGLLSIEIGGGTTQLGTIDNINWANGPYFIKSETDPTGGINYNISGTTELLSVPYALYAKSATEEDPHFQASAASKITHKDIKNWNKGVHSGEKAKGKGKGKGNRGKGQNTDSTDVANFGFVAGEHTLDTQIDSAGIAALGYVAGPKTIDTDTKIDSLGIVSLGFVAGPKTIDTDTQIDSLGIVSLGFVAGPKTVNTDTQLDSADIANLGYVAGPKTIDTDTQIDSLGIVSLGFVAGPKTIDTDTQIDSLGIVNLGFVAGPKTIDTDTQLDSADIASLGYVAGPKTIDTDTQIDSLGIVNLGFVAGPKTVDTDTQLDSTDIANLGYVAGPKTIDTDTQIDSAGIASLGFVANAIQVEVDGSVSNELQALSISNDTIFLTDGGFVKLPTVSTAGISSFIQDQDGDTQILTEIDSNDNFIRFMTEGTEHFRMLDGRLEVLNIGSIFIGEGAGAGLYNSRIAYNIGIGSDALRSNTSGNRNVAIGYQSLYSNTFGSSNVATGLKSLYFNTRGKNNIATGYESLYYNDAGNNNIAIGTYALFNNKDGDNNIATGYESLHKNDAGNNNISTGYQSLYSNTTGDDNISTGYQSLYSNSVGRFNIATGHQSLYSNTTGADNIAAGYQSLYSNTTGIQNIASGYKSLSNNSTGHNNIALGYRSNSGNTTGSNNIALGFNSGVGTGNLTNAIAIGANAKVNISNALVLGSNANVGIGTGSPSSKLDVVGDVQISSDLKVGNSIVVDAGLNQVGIGTIYPSSNLDVVGDVEVSEDLKVDGFTFFVDASVDRVGIGTHFPSKGKLHVNGSINGSQNNFGYLNHSGTGVYAPIGSWGYSIHASHAVAASEFHAFSDLRIKNIKGQSNSAKDLAIIAKIEITDYQLIDTIGKGNQHYKKVIAQQVKAVYPIAVNSMQTEVIPNIYQLAEIENNWIALGADLELGDRVKLIFEEKEEIVKVDSISSYGFKVQSNTNLPNGKVFVYGKEVNDFHSVDYEAIAMLNVSATQELLKRLQRLEAKNDTLKAVTNKQEFSLNELRTQLKEIKAMLGMQAAE